MLDIHGKIVAGERIDSIRIGAGEQELLQLLPKAANVEILEHATLYTFEPWKIWVDTNTQKVTQISVGNGFEGRFLEAIGIRSTLAQLKNVAGPVTEDLGVYILEAHPGICFELEDVENWDELKAPIEFISVFQKSATQSSDWEVERLPWHDCVVLEISFDCQARAINLVFDPNDEMLEASAGITSSPKTATFSGVTNIEVFGGFEFFVQQNEVDGEIIRATFKSGGQLKACKLEMGIYKRQNDPTTEQHGGVTFEYEHALWM